MGTFLTLREQQLSPQLPCFRCVSVCASIEWSLELSYGAFFNAFSACEKSWKVIPHKKGIPYLLIAPINRNIFTWIVRGALNAISDRNTNKSLRFSRNRKLLPYNNMLKHQKLTLTSFIQCRTTIIYVILSCSMISGRGCLQKATCL